MQRDVSRRFRAGVPVGSLPNLALFALFGDEMITSSPLCPRTKSTMIEVGELYLFVLFRRGNHDPVRGQGEGWGSAPFVFVELKLL